MSARRTVSRLQIAQTIRKKGAHQIVDDLAVPASVIVAQLARNARSIDIHRRELLRDAGAAETVVLELVRSCRCRVACGVQVRKRVLAAYKALQVRISSSQNPFPPRVREIQGMQRCARGELTD